MTLENYREWADNVGGEVGKKIQEILNELEEAQNIARGNSLPPLLGNKEVAELLEIDPKNMHHTRRTKLFPDPDLVVGNRPFWFKTSIQKYQERIEEWRSGKEK
ncbi:hypothetical protein [Paenibacillus pseudetheri]|uniref:DNA-binding protein n=1 Tax=Paenibacillus pseudetheri TaxID=2897682 RepID=A0ABN8F7L9_9BACL|nr:hypothetical protein [Paenibacillus pseudetheri]CAH1054043.1 hypothetical protein PAECIP111894_00188 [Paenibacillus pseudetheri]